MIQISSNAIWWISTEAYALCGPLFIHMTCNLWAHYFGFCRHRNITATHIFFVYLSLRCSFLLSMYFFLRLCSSISLSPVCKCLCDVLFPLKAEFTKRIDGKNVNYTNSKCNNSYLIYHRSSLSSKSMQVLLTLRSE